MQRDIEAWVEDRNQGTEYPNLQASDQESLPCVHRGTGTTGKAVRIRLPVSDSKATPVQRRDEIGVGTVLSPISPHRQNNGTYYPAETRVDWSD